MFFDVAIWVDCSFSTAMARALERAQEGLPPAATIRAYDKIYFAAQRIHLDRDNPRGTADFMLDNDQSLGRQVWSARPYRAHARVH